MSELDKLEKHLKDCGIRHERVDEDGDWGRHQIIVTDEGGNVLWDAICQRGSYGYDNGLLEIYGAKIVGKSGEVIGWLTAEDVIRMMKEAKS